MIKLPPERASAAVIVSFNSGPQLLEAVASARLAGAAPVFVIDNNSTDDAWLPLRHQSPDVRIVRLARNVGFAQASNLGAALAMTPYVLFLNDDARLLPDYLDILTRALERAPDAASAQGKLIYDTPGGACIDSAGIRLDLFALRPTDRGQNERDRGQYDADCDIFGTTGAASVFRRAAFVASNGGFDESFFAYYEDVDLAWRLKKAGWRHLYRPKAIAHHARRGPIKKPPGVRRRAFVNRYTTLAKNMDVRAALGWAPCAVPWEFARLLRIALGQPKEALAIALAAPQAVVRGFRGRFDSRVQSPQSLTSAGR